MTNKWKSLNRNLFTKKILREVIFLRHMQANYVSYKSTFIIEKTLPQNSLNVKQINSIFKILVHTLLILH